MKYIYLLTVAIVLTSCGTSHVNLAAETTQKPIALDYSILEGHYENGIEGDEYEDLWNDLIPHKSHFKSRSATIDTYVALKMLDSETLQVQLCSDEGEELDQMKLKASADKFYLDLKPRSGIFPFLVINVLSKNTTSIGNDADGNLILLQSDYDYFFFFGLESESDDFIDATYLRYEKPQKNPLPIKERDSL